MQSNKSKKEKKKSATLFIGHIFNGDLMGAIRLYDATSVTLNG